MFRTDFIHNLPVKLCDFGGIYKMICKSHQTKEWYRISIKSMLFCDWQCYWILVSYIATSYLFGIQNSFRWLQSRNSMEINSCKLHFFINFVTLVIHDILNSFKEKWKTNTKWIQQKANSKCTYTKHRKCIQTWSIFFKYSFIL